MKNHESLYFKEAFKLYLNEEYQVLFEYCKEVTKVERNNIELWKLFGVSAGMTGNANIALLCNETVNRIEPNNNINIINLITSYFHAGQAQKAIDYICANEENFTENMVLKLKGIIVQAQEQYDVTQIIQSLPKNIQKSLFTS